MKHLVREVASLIEQVVGREALSRFRRLGPDDVATKHAGELVTVADRAVEERLADSLSRLVPGSVVVGEEGIATSSTVAEVFRQDIPTWLVDPIDGTHDFVHGRTGFSTVVALCSGRRTIAAWLYAPLLQLMMTAQVGAGTRINGVPVRVRPAEALLGMRVIVTHPSYQTPTDRTGIGRLRRAGLLPVPAGSVGVAYIRLACGQAHAAVFGWEKPWDHVAGLLAHAEAGGAHAGRDGAAFRGWGRQLPSLRRRPGPTHG